VRTRRRLTKLSIETVLDYFDGLIRKLDAPPIIMGHSFGGLFTQLLTYRGLGSAGVAIDPGAPAGVLGLPFSTLKIVRSGAREPVERREGDDAHPGAVPLRLHQHDLRRAIEGALRPLRRALRESGPVRRCVRELRAALARQDRRDDRSSAILLIAGGADHLVTPDYTQSNFKLISKSSAITAFKEFPGRPHFTGGVDGWEAVADYALDWALKPVATEAVQ